MAEELDKALGAVSSSGAPKRARYAPPDSASANLVPTATPTLAGAVKNFAATIAAVAYRSAPVTAVAEGSAAAASPPIANACVERAARKLVVFSRTLDSVEGNARLASSSVAEELAVVFRTTDKDVEIGGAGLAAAAVELDLVETRAFDSRVIHERYRWVHADAV